MKRLQGNARSLFLPGAWGLHLGGPRGFALLARRQGVSTSWRVATRGGREFGNALLPPVAGCRRSLLLGVLR